MVPRRGSGRGPMKIAVVKEIQPAEKRVAATPATVVKLRKLGFEVLVQAGAGAAADHDDGAYREAGATIVPDAASLWSQGDVVLKVRQPEERADGAGHEAELLREGGILVGFVWPGQNPSLVERLGKRRATVLAMDAVPRITRAQKMDALSAMANI